MTNQENKAHEGECFCGAVALRAAGEPLGMGYCHCSSCRQWSGAPINAYTLWPVEAFEVTRGGEHIGSFARSAFSERKYCAKCGGHLYVNHPTLNIVDICAGVLPTLDFKPAMHINYAETVLPMRDGLPKYRGFPAEAGGSGALMAE